MGVQFKALKHVIQNYFKKIKTKFFGQLDNLDSNILEVPISWTSYLAKFFYFIDLKEDEKCFPCILIKGDVDKNGTDQCVHNSNLFEFEGFSTPDLIKNLGKSDEDKEKDKKEK